jgi:hypothetical protein
MWKPASGQPCVVEDEQVVVVVVVVSTPEYPGAPVLAGCSIAS